MMNRRTFLAAMGAVSALPLALQAAPLEYEPGMVNSALANGETVFLDFKASWCSTCAAQTRVLDSLKGANPAYEEAITFINIDWDRWKDSSIRTSLKVPRRSTLIVLKGKRELGRLVAQTSEAQIRALMDTALAAATG